MRRKKIVIVILTLIMATCMIFSFCSCKIDSGLFESGYFICDYYKEDGKIVGVRILKLTELGKEQEMLVFPEKINGYRVNSLGGRVSGLVAIPYAIESDVLRKVYLQTKMEHGSGIHRKNNHNLAIEIVIFSIEDNGCANLGLAQGMPFKYYADINSSEYRGRRVFYQCNVFFHNNYEIEKDIYWIDIINENPYNMVPPDPKRSNNTFGGWYYEKECLNKWNEEFVLNSDNELHLYAKWIGN